MRTRLCITHWVLAWVLAILSASASAEGMGFKLVESSALDELWVNLGSKSQHFNEVAELNDDNFGLGVEYRFSTVSSFTLGEYLNSGWRKSEYLGFYWQPVTLGSVRLGAAIGAMNGYLHLNHGREFIGVLPAASWDYQRVGINLLYVIPNGETIGALSVQFKFKLY